MTTTPRLVMPCGFNSTSKPREVSIHPCLAKPAHYLYTALDILIPMAEALAVVGVVASIVQLVDFSSKILRRLEEFHTNAGELPKSFRHINAELAVLKDTLLQTKEAIDTGSVEDRTERALLPAIQGCWEQIAQLDAVLAKTLPEANDSLMKRSKKAIVSLQQDAKVESVAKILRNYVGILTFYYAAASSTLQPLTGRYPS
jgi:hypothetical protein